MIDIEEDIERLVLLREKLLSLNVYKKENKLDFIDVTSYKKQSEIINTVIKRLEVRNGPNIFVVFGGNRSGKSETGGIIVSTVLRDFKDQRIWCATLSDLSVKVQQRKLADLIRKRDIEYGEYNEVRGWKNRVIKTKNRSTLYFKSYEQGAQAFQGDDVDLIWFDEECPFDVFSESMIRLADRSGVILMTFTSLMGFTRVVNRVWESRDENVKLWVLTPKENPFLSEDSKKQLFANMDSDERQSRWEGKPHLKTGLIYKEFCQEHKIPRFDYASLVKKDPGRWEISEGIDPHERTPHHWLRFLYDRKNNILYVVDELKAPYESMLVADFARLIKNDREHKIGSNADRYIAYTQIDTYSMRPSVIQTAADEDQTDIFTIRKEFAKHGINTVLVTKDNAVGFNAVKARLKIVRNSLGDIKRKPLLYVFDDLHGFNFEINRYSWDSFSSAKISEKREQVNQPLKKDDHYMDVLKYECIKRNYVEDMSIKLDNFGNNELYEGTGY